MKEDKKSGNDFEDKELTKQIQAYVIDQILSYGSFVDLMKLKQALEDEKRQN